MKNATAKLAVPLSMAAVLLGGTTWSPDSHACAAEPYLSAVCIMATANGYGSFANTYMPAMGQLLPLAQYQALASLVGTTWGGDMRTTIGLPDLRGRVVVGSGVPAGTSTNYQAGQFGGAPATVLTLQQLPAHTHTLAGATVDVSKLTATTTLTGLTTTTDLANVHFTSSSSNLSIKASNSAAASANPTTSSSLATLSAGLNAKLYGTSAPDTTMQAGTVVGTVSGTLSGTAPGTVSGGTASTTIGGTAGVAGTTSSAGSSAQVSLMQPYLVMNYYIAVNNGLYPSRD